MVCEINKEKDMKFFLHTVMLNQEIQNEIDIKLQV